MSTNPRTGAQADAERGRGLVRRALRRLASSNAQLENEDRQRVVREAGAMPINTCSDRQLVDLCGDVASVTINPHGGKPALEVELRDGSGSVTLVWLGRRRIPGIEPGRSIRVGGRMSCAANGRRVVFNPRYELL
ncbi:MAG: OB-fold nucleic acid binding domain-containing protein [Microlunatus sp.]|nr:OB-fold nucleic acid binding domain-containing protein [Microlunatus sp.]